MEDLSARKRKQESRIAAILHDLDMNLEPYFFDSSQLYFAIRIKQPGFMLMAGVNWNVTETESLSDDEITSRLRALAQGHPE